MPPIEQYNVYLLICLLVHHDAARVVVRVMDELELVPRAEGHDQVSPTTEEAGANGA